MFNRFRMSLATKFLNDFHRLWICLKSPVIIFKNIVEDSKRIVTKNLVFLIFVASIYKTKIDTNIKVITV